jgi:hypothetical protein
VTSIWKRKREFLSNNDADDLLFIMERYVRRRGEKKLKGAMPARLIELGADWMMNRLRCCSPFHRNHQIG